MLKKLLNALIKGLALQGMSSHARHNIEATNKHLDLIE
jgi:hypothetical protein